ncbi:MAG TPA: FAD-dependent oxidoreductase, partial [Chromatiales bacterium]|nr:FAD-dependent oxidoreductase [Chromatiales bacterium]
MSKETVAMSSANEDAAYDVIVVGGGVAGVSAAIQAGRAGARTMLVERTGQPGGTATTGGVSFPGLFHAWGRQVIGGIGWELVTRCVAESGDTLPDFADYRRPHWHHQILINPFIYAALCDEALLEAGVDVLFHTMIAEIRPTSTDAGWRVTICTKRGLSSHIARVVIDATGDANLAAMASLPVRVHAETQPATLCCLAGGYDPGELDVDAINRAFEAEVRAGRLTYEDASWDTSGPDVGNWLRKRGANASHVRGINAYDSEGRTRLELEARRSLLRLFRFLRRQPGLENIVIQQAAPECGVRETTTVVGKRTVTVEDYQSGRIWDDAVCYSFYPIDLHTASGEGVK